MLLQKLKERIKPFSCNMQYVSLQWNVQMINLCQDNPLDTALNSYKKSPPIVRLLGAHFFYTGTEEWERFFQVLCQLSEKAMGRILPQGTL